MSRRRPPILYRTNAQSRAIEDSLMREAIPYKVIGGVRFYERKEIKDALAYMKLIINPHDDVSLRRVINVPARGIGKGVMDSLQAIDPDAVLADAPPLLAAGLQEISSARSLWARLVYAVDEGKLTPRAVASLQGLPRSDRRAGPSGAARLGVDHDRQDARSDWLPEGSSGRQLRGVERAHREPDGARVRRPRLRSARGGSVAWRLRRSAVAAVGSRRGVREPERARLADDHARGEGAGVSGRHHRGNGGGAVPALALEPTTKKRSRRNGDSATWA